MKYLIMILGMLFLVFMWLLTIYCIQNIKDIAYGWLFIVDTMLTVLWGVFIGDNIKD